MRLEGWRFGANAGTSTADDVRHHTISVMLGLVPSICGIAN
jgi:hypothetical protein